MTRPLYGAAVQEPASREPGGHAGLWFDKFCNQWQVGDDSWTMSSQDKASNPKLDWIRTVADCPIGIREQLDESTLRLTRLIHRRGGRVAVFTAEARFVTGLGRSHPVENGFAWHPTLGTPYLPGSSVKGLVRSWAEMDAEPRPDARTRERLLGAPGKAGGMCFLDAVPVAPVRLEADVMTPHYAGWSKSDPPGDWRSPKPVPFLTTAADTSFLFGIIPCREVANGDLDTVSDWLRCALAWAGAGAKTAVGYGRFRHDDERTTRWMQRLSDEDRERSEERARQEAMKSPEGRWRLKLQSQTEAQILDLVRIHLEKEPLEDPAERRAFADAVSSTDMVQHWRRGNKKDPRTLVGKKKLKERARLVASVHG